MRYGAVEAAHCWAARAGAAVVQVAVEHSQADGAQASAPARPIAAHRPAAVGCAVHPCYTALAPWRSHLAVAQQALAAAAARVLLQAHLWRTGSCLPRVRPAPAHWSSAQAVPARVPAVDWALAAVVQPAARWQMHRHALQVALVIASHLAALCHDAATTLEALIARPPHVLVLAAYLRHVATVDSATSRDVAHLQLHTRAQQGLQRARAAQAMHESAARCRHAAHPACDLCAGASSVCVACRHDLAAPAASAQGGHAGPASMAVAPNLTAQAPVHGCRCARCLHLTRC